MSAVVEVEPDEYALRFHEAGFAVLPRLLSDDEIERLRAAITAIPDSDAVRRKRNVYGVRNLLDLSPEIRRLAALPEVRQLVTPILGEGAFAARAIFFDKVPGANWALGWHQDRPAGAQGRAGKCLLAGAVPTRERPNHPGRRT